MLSGGCWAVLITVATAGALAWTSGIFTSGYDYDEVLRARSAFLASEGLRPYHDFFETHPPYFILLAPLTRITTDPKLLLDVLRCLAGAGNLLFLAGLATLAGRLAASRIAGAWLTAVTACHPAVLRYLVEFRLDGWGYAAMVWSVVFFGGLPKLALPVKSGCFGFSNGLATFFVSPKLALFPPLVLAFHLLAGRREPRLWLRAVAAYATGTGAACALFWVFLAGNSIELGQAWSCIVTYNAVSNARAGFGLGLLESLVGIPAVSLPVAMAGVAWVIKASIQRKALCPLTAALTSCLVIQAVVVSYPYKQYYGPWVLLGAGILASWWPSLLGRFPRGMWVLFLGISVASVSGSILTGRTWFLSHGARDAAAVMESLAQIAGPDEFVAAAPPAHPIFRRDTFFLGMNTIDPKGFESESIMEQVPKLKGRVTAAHYRAELESHPPVLVVGPRWSSVPQRQAGVLEEFVREQRYLTIENGKVQIAVHPDRFEQANRLLGGE